MCCVNAVLMFSDRFDVDEVGVAALAVWRAARYDDRIAFFDEPRIARGAFCKVEQNVYRVVFLAHHGQNAPTERKFPIAADIRRHADDVDHGAEAGDHFRRAPRARAYDDRLCLYVARKRASRVRERVRNARDAVVLFVDGLDKVLFALRLLRDARHCRDSLYGIEPRGGLAREHHGARTVVNGVCHVRDLRTGGAGLFNHGFKHFRRRNAALARAAAGVDDGLLNVGQFLVGDLYAHVAAPDHDAVRNFEDGLQVVHARAVFDFCDEVDVVRAVLVEEFADVDDVLRFGDEGASHKVHALLDAEEQIALILIGEIDELELLFGEEHALAVGEFAADDDFTDDFRLFDLRHLEHHQSVVQQDLVAGVHLFADALIGDGDARLVAFHVFGGKGEGIAFFQKDLALFERLDAEFGTLGVQHDGEGDIFFVAHFFDGGDLFCMIFIGAVREIDAGDVHAGVRHGGDDLFRLRSGTERADDLCFFHKNSSGKNIPILFYHIF